MSNKLNAWYLAGRAIALAESGMPADVSLCDVPRMTPRQVTAAVAGGTFRVDLPSVSENGIELLPVIAASEGFRAADDAA